MTDAIEKHKADLMLRERDDLVDMVVVLLRQRDAYENQIFQLKRAIVEWLQDVDDPKVHANTILKMKVALFGH